ncbi:NAD(P)/FAD-dependent oxidoreductase [Roseinatronobacter alkalisoli]|uniref:NAD(P)/FAD-dependent oxidoreductase n=1 Tax=Roseinatronobacter alkalisoli TaxID=3028235 RepID=A0ABT5T4D0_9RHOB|nr:NAD(P)/FAD-dependent oxidoreductase [Roseinatronobacter sp. HJB301]MDD7969909.1 NAD(P)/FAD-dependent oxidoreductase [Roseinatronobacter sp. HJB301]
MQRFDVIILGAGAAGMFCAIEAGRRGRKVALIDHARAPGEKIRISGGGRCNFTNLHIGPEKFLSQNQRFALSALRRYTQQDFIERVRRAGIAFHEKTLGQLFCDGSAREIIAMLTNDMRDAGVRLLLGTQVSGVAHGNGFTVQTSAGVFQAPNLVVATGGKSIPKMGATGFGYQLAAQFGQPVVETRPALVPLTFAVEQLEELKPLAGIAVQAEVRCGKAQFREGMLFTHRGLSGPSILQISSYWREGQGIVVDLMPGKDLLPLLEGEKRRNGRQAVHTALATHLPEKLARQIVARVRVQGNLADQSKAALNRVRDAVKNWQLLPVGSEGYRTAEVTLGGVDTDALDARTMQARTMPGLFFIGEVVDVTGWLGGYNFQWAWSSGWVAGQAV